MKYRSEVFSKFKVWKAEVENQTGRKIKCLRTDNSTEYKEVEFLRFYEEHGTVSDFLVRHTPQQNNVTKKMNRTIVERARCMRLNAGLPKMFWVEVVNMACYIINRSPRVVLDVAKEVRSGKQVDYSMIRVFEYHAYVHMSSEERSKLGLKSKRCIFPGYERGEKVQALGSKGIEGGDK